MAVFKREGWEVIAAPNPALFQFIASSPPPQFFTFSPCPAPATLLFKIGVSTVSASATPPYLVVISHFGSMNARSGPFPMTVFCHHFLHRGKEKHIRAMLRGQETKRYRDLCLLSWR